MTSEKKVLVNKYVFDASNFYCLDLHADYRCGNSGHCCTEPWNIFLSGGELQNMRAALATVGADTASEKYFTPRPSDEMPDRVVMNRKECGACIFLEGEAHSTGCGFHRQFGHEQIPDVCQTFPRMIVATPKGLFLTLMYSCPTATKLLLKENALAEVRPRAVTEGRTRFQGATFQPGAMPPPFVDGIQPDWDTYNYFWRWASEFAARPDITPAQAISMIGFILGIIEANAKALVTLNPMMETLEQVSALKAEAIRAECSRFEPSTEIGLVYLETILKLHDSAAQKLGLFDGVLESLIARDAGRGALAGDYDRLIRPRIAEFELIERNYIASRLYGNPLTYRTPLARIGYFTVVLSIIGVRFTALRIAQLEDRAVDEKLWLEAVRKWDQTLLHTESVQRKIIDLLLAFSREPLRHISAAALF